MTQSLIDCWNQGDRWALASVLQRGVQHAAASLWNNTTDIIRTPYFKSLRLGCFKFLEVLSFDAITREYFCY